MCIPLHACICVQSAVIRLNAHLKEALKSMLRLIRMMVWITTRAKEIAEYYRDT